MIHHPCPRPYCGGSLRPSPEGLTCSLCARIDYAAASGAALASLASLAARAAAERGRTARTLGRCGPRMHREDGR